MYSLFAQNSNLTTRPVFLFAKPGNPKRTEGGSRGACKLVRKQKNRGTQGKRQCPGMSVHWKAGLDVCPGGAVSSLHLELRGTARPPIDGAQGSQRLLPTGAVSCAALCMKHPSNCKIS